MLDNGANYHCSLVPCPCDRSVCKTLPKGRSAEEGAVKPGPSFFACFFTRWDCRQLQKRIRHPKSSRCWPRKDAGQTPKNGSSGPGRNTDPKERAQEEGKRILFSIKMTGKRKNEGQSPSFFLVPLTGLAPVRILLRGILSPLCLPIPPQRRGTEIYHNIIQYFAGEVKGLESCFPR